jgi:hypothetical protein
MLALVLVSTIDLVCGAYPDIDAENGHGIASFLMDQLCEVAEECSEFWGRIGNDIFLAVNLWAYQRNILFRPLKWGRIRGVRLFWLASSFQFCRKIIKRTIKVRSLAIIKNTGRDRSPGGGKTTLPSEKMSSNVVSWVLILQALEGGMLANSLPAESSALKVLV